MYTRQNVNITAIPQSIVDFLPYTSPDGRVICTALMVHLSQMYETGNLITLTNNLNKL